MSQAIVSATQQNRNALATTLEQEREYVTSVIPVDKVDEFKNNYLELAQNSYLMKEIPLVEVLRTAVNATALGVNINPIYRECYILPFNTKSGKVASIVLEQDGHKNIAFQSGFFLDVVNVWSLNGKEKRESDMAYSELALLKTTDIEFVKEHLLGWEVILEDISDSEVKIPKQAKFVGLEFVLEATKQLQSPQYSIQTWVHKAVRRAMRDMFIPRHRKSVMLEKIDDWNNKNESREDAPILAETTTDEVTTVNLKKETEEVVEAVVEEAETKVQDIMDYYMNLDADAKGKVTTIMTQEPDWRTYESSRLAELLDKIKREVA